MMRRGVSFSSICRYPDNILWASRNGLVAIGTRGGAGFCSLLSIGYRRSDIATALAAAGPTNDIMEEARRLPDWRQRVAVAEKAISGALEMHSCHVAAVRIAAHETVGFGILSLLVDELDFPCTIGLGARGRGVEIRNPVFGACRSNIRVSSMEWLRNATASFSAEMLARGYRGAIDIPDGMDCISITSVPYSRNYAFGTLGMGASTDTIAYLWMALELGLNIMVECDVQQASMIVDAMRNLVPGHYRLALLDGQQAPEGFIGCTPDRLEALTAVDRVFYIGSSSKCIGLLFAVAARGTPVLLVRGSGILRPPEKPFAVDQERLECLDVLISVSGDGKITVSEFRWPSKGDAGFNNDERYARLAVCRMGIVDPTALPNSRMIRLYAAANAMTADDVIDELKLRSTYLSRLKAGSTPNIISGYMASKLPRARKYGRLK